MVVHKFGPDTFIHSIGDEPEIRDEDEERKISENF